MMRGLFRKERLLDVLHNFIYLPDTPKDEDKIVCRYPQYFATTQLFNNILKHSRLNPDGDGKGAHTSELQGAVSRTPCYFLPDN